MTIKKEEIFNELVKRRRSEVGNFDKKVQASILLHNLFESKGYNFYYTPKIKCVNNIEITPDFHANQEGKLDIIGEIKQSLSNPHGEEFKKIKEKDISQIKNYSEELCEISTPHDVFFASPQFCEEAIIEYIKQIDADPILKGKIIVLKYYLSKGDNHSKFCLDKMYGEFNDLEINNLWNWGGSYSLGEGDLEKIQGGYKILYTEEEVNETPIEYIMMVLWHNVLPELIKTSSFDKTIQRIKFGENSFEFYINDLRDILSKLYTLKISSNVLVDQFNKEMLIKAFEGFEKIKKARCLEKDKSNPKYQITFDKILKKGELIEYLIIELNKEEFEKISDIEFNKQNNKSLKLDIQTKDSQQSSIPAQLIQK